MAFKFLEKSVTFNKPEDGESVGTVEVQFDKKIIAAEVGISQWEIQTSDTDSIHQIGASIVNIEHNSNEVRVTAVLLFRGYWHSIIETSSMKVVIFAWCED